MELREHLSSYASFLALCLLEWALEWMSSVQREEEGLGTHNWDPSAASLGEGILGAAFEASEAWASWGASCHDCQETYQDVDTWDVAA